MVWQLTRDHGCSDSVVHAEHLTSASAFVICEPVKPVSDERLGEVCAVDRSQNA